MAKEEVWVGTGSIEIRDARVQSESTAVVLESPGLWHPVAEREGISDKEFQKRYAVDVAGATQIVQVSFADTDRGRARRIVDDILQSYVTRFRAPVEVLQTETLEAHLASLTELETSIIQSLDRSDDLPRLQQIDLQNELWSGHANRSQRSSSGWTHGPPTLPSDGALTPAWSPRHSSSKIRSPRHR